MTNLATNLTTTAARMPDQDALRVNGQGVTYGQLHQMAARVAGALRAHGVEPGDRVAVILPNVPAFPVVYWGVLLAGGIVVPMNPLLKAGEIDYFFTDSGAKIAFVWPDFVAEATKGAENSGTRVVTTGAMGPEDFEGGDAIADPTPREDDDTAVILYTSGTTGRPKGAELTHRNIHLNAHRSAEVIQEMTSDDVVMGCLPLFHVFGLTVGLNAATVAGASLALIPRFDPQAAIEVIEKERVTIMQGVPTMYAAILNHPGSDGMDASSLRTCASGGSAMPLEVMKAFEEKLGCMILEGYGLSETSPVASFNMPDRERKPGTIGVAIPGCEMRCVDLDGQEVPVGEVGEIAIRGDNVMKGYWNKPEATAEAIPDGWFRTGDLATMDDEGYFTIVDRKKDMILRGGMNVYPREVEEVIYQHPDVLEVAVVGMPDELLGEQVAAAVALREGSQATPEDIIAFTKERIAAYKYPRRVWVVEALPKGPTGKILRREVRAPSA
ncbi:long-chain fatty acid--CoA ligase [Phycicoccus endophyticus]|uniref:Long-chain fatty acid--CoA ligase n=1 Tax=Phycicoccus endophyticus TaxID=1690220 RepID=A0A7G9QYF5_9MICO|nr:long-chain fatty acid--CoA ligase [Phycicoccus endophyticus]NHI19276.1 long-chain fatty acid--CoA ligase [Phycicoccus endophyticus]QNN48380.1 long-chain fatty acid--CoA ligase [Phycicoccus endophyticus]GGL41462.1 long-chain-fatty-acid--CoA ligase [Phycicoccus endophyticus]